MTGGKNEITKDRYASPRGAVWLAAEFPQLMAPEETYGRFRS
jgi:hypothetical protein